MSAFGRRPGTNGQRPSFGVARPMKGGGSVPLPVDGGDQFPAIENTILPDDPSTSMAFAPEPGDAMARLNDSQGDPLVLVRTRPTGTRPCATGATCWKE